MDPRDQKSALPDTKAADLGNSPLPTLGNEHDNASTRQGSFHDDKIGRDVGSLENGSMEDLIEDKSRGVQEMECLVANINTPLLITIYAALILLSYVMSMNQYTAGVFLNYATSTAFKQHSLQSTINTVTAVFQAMAQPPIAKCADGFGRYRTYFGLVGFYVLGYIIVASSNGIVTYAVGNSIYVIGITGLFFLQNIIVADLSSTRYRCEFPLCLVRFPNILQCINGFVAGEIASSLLAEGDKPNNWRWGYGMFCILIPVVAAPIIFVMWYGSRPNVQQRAQMQAAQQSRRQEAFSVRSWRSVRALFWQLDFIGLILFIIGFGLFFVTITTANSRTARWSDAHSIAQLIVGAVVIIAFVVYERWYSPHPLLPFALMKRKTVIGCMFIALLSPMGGRITSQYLQTFLQVAAGQSVKSATNITSYPTVAGTVTGILASLLAARLRTLKWFIVAGFCMQALGTGLMIRYRTSTNSQAELAIVQIIRGIASGLLPYPTQALIQTASPHEQLASITAGWLVIYYIAGGIGAAIGGSIWTNVAPKEIAKYFASVGNATAAAQAYQDPLGFIKLYPMGTPEREAISKAQDHAQRIMVIAGLSVTLVALLVSIFLLDNIRTTDEQSLPESDEVVHEEKRQAKKNKKTVRTAMSHAAVSSGANYGQ